MAAAGTLGGKNPTLFLFLAARLERSYHSGAEWHVAPPFGGLALVHVITIVGPIDIFPAHDKDLFVVSHARITHDHQYVAQRLLQEGQKLGFGVFIDHALAFILHQQFDLGRGPQQLPFDGLAQHATQGAQRIVVIGRTTGKTEPFGVISGNGIHSHRSDPCPDQQPPPVPVVDFALFGELALLDPFKKA
jgi:hypothetical protein